jgi:Methyltransferase domain
MPRRNPILRSRSQRAEAPILDFTAHNILLPDGTRTKPDIDWLIADSPWMAATRRVIALLFPYGPQGHSIIDLGCLEGGYTLEFARMGLNALGVEVRESNFDNCLLIKDSFPDLCLKFVKADVWNSRQFGTFDVAFCCGLLYHLDRPLEFVRLLGDIARRAVILNTHVADPLSNEVPPSLSAMTEHEGVPGRWYSEYDPAAMDDETLDKARWTSWSNHRSFWPTAPALQQALQEAGFDLVFEQGDWLAPDISKGMSDPFYSVLGRRMLVGVRTERARPGLFGKFGAMARRGLIGRRRF